MDKSASCQALTISNVQLWFALVLRDGFATAAAGHFATFKDIGEYHLHKLLAQSAAPGDHSKAVQTILSGFDGAECMDDVGPAFKQMHAEGIKVCTPHDCLGYITKQAL